MALGSDSTQTYQVAVRHAFRCQNVTTNSIIDSGIFSSWVDILYIDSEQLGLRIGRCEGSLSCGFYPFVHRYGKHHIYLRNSHTHTRI